jgi:2'-5' RNA ligase
MMIRSFLAFELPLEIKRTVKQVSEDVRRSKLNVKLLNVDNIHLTVVFMGNIKTEDIPAIEREIKRGCAGFDPFDISLKGLGLFPNARRPRVLWLGIECETERMSSLKTDLQERLRIYGVKEEKREFRPHLTLGRFRKSNRSSSPLEGIITRYKGLESPVFTLKELVMFKSKLTPKGAEYTKLASWPLKGP